MALKGTLSSTIPVPFNFLFCVSFQVCDFWDSEVLHASFAAVALSLQRNISLAENFVLSSPGPKSGSAIPKLFQTETCSIFRVTWFYLLSYLNNPCYILSYYFLSCLWTQGTDYFFPFAGSPREHCYHVLLHILIFRLSKTNSSNLTLKVMFSTSVDYQHSLCWTPSSWPICYCALLKTGNRTRSYECWVKQKE